MRDIVHDYITGLSIVKLSLKYKRSRKYISKIVRGTKRVTHDIKIIKEYKEGTTIRKLIRAYGLGRTTIKKILISSGVTLRTTSERSRLAWEKPTRAMLDAVDTNKLNSKTAVEKKRRYFSSDVHRKKARTQAKKAWQARKEGILPPLPHVKTYDTRPELAVESSLCSHKVAYEKQKQIGPYTFDFYLPKYNILIEVQGEYWHSLPNNIRNDLAKRTFIERYHPELSLRYIEEIDTVKRLAVHNIVHHITNKNIEILPVDFNALVMKVIPHNEAVNFMKQHHYLPRFRKISRIALGVFYQDALIAVAMYGIPTYKSISAHYGVYVRQMLELVRFTINPEYQVKNLASWALSKSIKIIKKSMADVCLLVSFADPHFGHKGTIYKAANWTEDGKTRPSYYYVEPDGGFIHKKTLWNHAVGLGVTESDYAKHNGFRRVDTPPKTKFIYWIFKPPKVLPKTTNKVRVVCLCGKQSTIGKWALERAITKHGAYTCHSCAMRKKWKNSSYRNKVLSYLRT